MLQRIEVTKPVILIVNSTKGSGIFIVVPKVRSVFEKCSVISVKGIVTQTLYCKQQSLCLNEHMHVQKTGIRIKLTLTPLTLLHSERSKLSFNPIALRTVKTLL